MEIKGLGAIVTGGGSGLGAATARLLAARGARVAILDFDGHKAATVAAEVGGFAVRVDVSEAAEVEQAVEAAAEWIGAAPRVAVNCAGIANGGRVVGREGKLSIDTFERVLRVNLFGTYNVMSHAARLMVAADMLEGGERGVIVNTASIAYEDGQVGQAAYAASKGAVAAMCLPAARDLARHGVRVMAIAPGLFRTPMMEGLAPEVTEKIVADIQFPARLGDPAEYALMVAQIVENPYLNGTTIRLDAATRLPPK
jgi:NAD(P)-dependent dehydrogenase (short-subunit alcohol dehydrogenase family)